MSGSIQFLLKVAVQPTPGSFSSSLSLSSPVGKYDGSKGFRGSDFAIEQVYLASYRLGLFLTNDGLCSYCDWSSHCDWSA